jgi:hypothetical protein
MEGLKRPAGKVTCSLLLWKPPRFSKFFRQVNLLLCCFSTVYAGGTLDALISNERETN